MQNKLTEKEIRSFVAAITHGDDRTVRKCLAKNPELAKEVLGSDGAGALHHAAAANQVDCLNALLPLGDPNQTMFGGSTPLMMAAKNGAAEAVAALLPVSNALIANKLGETALLLAAEKQRLACVKMLLPVSDANARMRAGGLTALMIAAGWQDLGAIRALLPFSEAKTKADDGMTALMCAAGDADCVRELLPHSDVEAQDQDNLRAWDRALRHERWESADLMFSSLGLSGARRLWERIEENGWKKENFPRSQALLEQEALAGVVASKAKSESATKSDAKDRTKKDAAPGRRL